MNWPEPDSGIPDGHYTIDEAKNVIRNQMIEENSDIPPGVFEKFFQPSEHDGFFVPIQNKPQPTLHFIKREEPGSGHWGAVKY